MTTQQAYIVYTNLVKMYGYRNLSVDKILPISEFTASFNNDEYVTLLGSRTNDPLRPDSRTATVVINDKSKYIQKGTEVKKLLNLVLGKKSTTTPITDVLIVSHKALSNSVNKYIVEYIEETGINIDAHIYTKFCIEMPKHSAVPKHSIATAEEIELWRDFYLTKETFPKILSSDTQAVWIGLEPGMVCRIDRESEASGKSVVYRYCVK